MKLSISNIAWSADQDPAVYSFLQEQQIDAIEIAPTRIFPSSPYRQLKQASSWASDLKAQYGLSVSSMQSIWYGKTENLFSSPEERLILSEYTKAAIDFAAAVSCHNLVFGCPRNRCTDENSRLSDAVDFFHELGEYAATKDTVLALEANPPIYHTNFINTTAEAIKLIQVVASRGFLLNLDIGTMLYNKETPDFLYDHLSLINHIHISEPGLKQIERHPLHNELAALLHSQYQNYVSVEMGHQDDIAAIKNAIYYMKGLFQ